MPITDENVGDSFEDFLEEQGLLEECTETAIRESSRVSDRTDDERGKIKQNSHGRQNAHKPGIS